MLTPSRYSNFLRKSKEEILPPWLAETYAPHPVPWTLCREPKISVESRPHTWQQGNGLCLIQRAWRQDSNMCMHVYIMQGRVCVHIHEDKDIQTLLVGELH